MTEAQRINSMALAHPVELGGALRLGAGGLHLVERSVLAVGSLAVDTPVLLAAFFAGRVHQPDRVEADHERVD